MNLPPSRAPAFCALALSVTSALGASCAGDGVGLTESGDPPGPFAAVQAIFDARCVQCHVQSGIGYTNTGGDAGNGLDLSRGRAHGALVAQPTFEEPAIAPRWRVLAGEPDSSYLVQKIASEEPKAGGRMPLTGPPFLSASEIQMIRDWILVGAPDEGEARR